MKISMKVEYACQVLAQLGKRYGQHPMPHIEELAEAEEIPSNYLVQILNELRNAGLIVSRRGKQGGYALADAPEKVSLFDIITAVDGDLIGVSGNAKGESSSATQQVWKQVSEELERVTRAITIRDLMGTEAGAMWYI